MEQTEGEAHCVHQGKVVRARLFYANLDTERAMLRVPRFVGMTRLDSPEFRFGKKTRRQLALERLRKKFGRLPAKTELELLENKLMEKWLLGDEPETPQGKNGPHSAENEPPDWEESESSVSEENEPSPSEENEPSASEESEPLAWEETESGPIEKSEPGHREKHEPPP
jgi:hypothetical protein